MNNNNTDINVSAEEEHDNLGELVIDCVKRAGLQKIRPAQLSKELGISIDEASEELCGLLAAVGGGQNGASFVFEPVATARATNNDAVSTAGQEQQQQHYTMVFTFPADFERRCKTYRIKQELKETFWYVCENLFKFIRAVLSFGLILSLSIVALVALIAIFSAMIAIASRQGNNNNRRGGGGINNFFGHHGNMRRFISSIRRLLWIYVFLTPAGNNNDSDLMWNVRDFLMMTSFWYNPLWFMFSLRSRMNRRRYRMRRGWGWSSTRANNSSSSSPADEFLSTNIDGVYTNNRRSWQGNNNQHVRRSNNNAANQSNQEPLFLLINNIMEFLFGPENQSRTNPSIQSRWKSRARFITDQGGKVSLEDLMPFVDYPSSSSSSEALLIVSYFNGVPCSTTSTSNVIDNTVIFEFPELMVETEMLPESKYSQYLIQSSEDENEASIKNNLNLDKFWSNFLYKTEEGEEEAMSSSFTSAVNSTTEDDDGNSTASLQQHNNNKHYLVEYPCVMTRLKKDNFMKCVGLGIVNYVGVSMIYKGLVSGAIELPLSMPLFLVAFICGFIKVLSWYSALFFILFLVRMIFLVPFNVLILKRNKLRMKLVARCS